MEMQSTTSLYGISGLHVKPSLKSNTFNALLPYIYENTLDEYKLQYAIPYHYNVSKKFTRKQKKKKLKKSKKKMKTKIKRK